MHGHVLRYDDCRKACVLRSGLTSTNWTLFSETVTLRKHYFGDLSGGIVYLSTITRFYNPNDVLDRPCLPTLFLFARTFYFQKKGESAIFTA